MNLRKLMIKMLVASIPINEGDGGDLPVSRSPM
jgi:hypothetical protein